MAASIKMDELLVSWLGTDAVYENVMSLIEKKRHEPPAQEGADGEKPVDGDDNDASAANSSNDGTNATANTSTAAGGEAGGDEEGSSVVIPPFYSRPPPSSPGKKGGRPASTTGAPYPRYRRQLSGPSAFADDQTWEGTGVKAAGSGPGGGPNDPSQGQQAGDGVLENMPTSPASSDIQTGASAEGVSSPSSEPGLDTANPVGLEGAGSTDDGGGAGGGGPAGVGTNAENEPVPCIRDQVRAIYDELAVGADGQQQPVSTKSSDEEDAEEDTKDDDPAYTSRYLPVDAFVRITKEVCQFPTFFNAPLYRRILDLWNAKHNGGADNDASRIPALDLNATETTDSADATNATSGEMEVVTYGMFKWYWTTEMEEYDASERFFRLIKQPDAEYIVRDDFLPYIQELLKDHPGLEFLSNHAEFQEKYAITVITRIFYSVNRCHDGRITSRQIRRSDLIAAFQLVDEEEDINKVTRYFSYEHFYVLYCRFWELDHDRDYRITREDLLKYGDHCLSHMIVDRIFDAAPRPFVESGPWTGAEEGGDEAAAAAAGNDPASPPLSPASADVSDAPDRDQEVQDGGDNKTKGTNREFLSYEDFIFFMLSEEDKASEISIRYWFSCIDVDGDGRLNNMEMRSFYAVQLHRMQCMGHEVVPFEDMLCQMIDMIKPECNDYLVPEDFLKPECAQVSGALFDALFNLNKYLMFEQRDPFMERQKREDEFDTDWDRFACIDYNRLAMEEEAREEEAMEIDWVTVDDEDEDGDEYNSMGLSSSEAPF